MAQHDQAGIVDRIDAYLRQAAPHIKEREAAKLLREARDEIVKVRGDHQEAINNASDSV